MPEVSVIVPVYNVEKYLHRCINSILTQTFQAFELLLIDDGSPDNSGAICDEYAAIDPRVKVFHKENGGVSSARNCGLDHAQGTYIMFCDSDDYVADTWIEKLYKVMQQDGVEFGLCGYMSVSDATGEVIAKIYHPGPDISTIPPSSFWILQQEKLMNVPWNKILLREIIELSHLRFKTGIQYGEDTLFMLSYILACSGDFGICSACLNYYVQGIAGSLTNRYVKNMWKIWKELYETRDKVLLKSGISLNDIKEAYYTKWIWSITLSINNNMLKGNGLTLRKALIENQKILSSDECKTAFAYGDFKDFNKLYTPILKTRSALLIWLFHKAVQLKHKLLPKH